MNDLGIARIRGRIGACIFAGCVFMGGVGAFLPSAGAEVPVTDTDGGIVEQDCVNDAPQLRCQGAPGADDALWEDQIGVAYELTSTGGPEVKAAAEAAVLGDREGLYEFATVERYRRQALDSQREAYGAQFSRCFG